MNKKTRNRGFTLIEAVVSTAVFAFAITSVLGVYMATLKLDSKTKAQRAVTQNARFIMEFIAKEVRNGRINYSAYAGGDPSTDLKSLHIVNQALEEESLELVGPTAGINVCTGSCNLTLTKGGLTTNLNSSGVNVARLIFYVDPDTDPYTPAKNANVQPHVTVLLQLRSNYGNRPGDTAVIYVQSTFTQRYYPSRQ